MFRSIVFKSIKEKQNIYKYLLDPVILAVFKNFDFTKFLLLYKKKYYRRVVQIHDIFVSTKVVN